MKDSSHLREGVLIFNLKKGSKKAFDEIYRMYSKRLFVYCVQFTKLPEDAEEIVQDVFVRLWKTRESIRQEETLQSLLFIMTKHLLINAYRSTVNSPIYENYIDYQENFSINDTGDRLEYAEFIQKLNKILLQLPETQQRVIELSRMQGITNKEIARTLSLSEQTVKNQLSLGLKALRAHLDKELVMLWIILFLNR